MIEIKRRNTGRIPTKYGIVVKDFPKRYKRILNDNPIIKKYSDDDNFIITIFQIEDNRIKINRRTRPFINVENKEIDTYQKIKDSYNEMDWTCAYCKKPIKSRIDDLSPKNYTCERCFGIYIKDAKKINQRIIDSSFEFTETYKRKMLENQKSFIKYIKRNEK